MFRFHTTRSPDEARFLLHDLVSRGDLVGDIEGDYFHLQSRPQRRAFPLVLYLSVIPKAGGTIVTMWPFPHWSMLVWFPICTLFALSFIRDSLWFVALAFVLCIAKFITQTCRYYALLRRTYA
jgi:hypothetical protein